jgi:SAM-dependent methyltransferase
VSSLVNPNQYGVSDLIHNGIYYDALNFSNSHDLPFYAKYCKQVRGAVLELCCGTGRLTIPLAKDGVKITGLDFTPSMLEMARNKALQAGVDVPFFQSDMRDFELNKKFDLIFIPFNSLQNTYTVNDVQSILRRVQHHLNAGGLFIFDIFNPCIELMVDRSRTPHEFRYRLPNGREVKVTETCRYDAAGQVNRVTWRQHIEGEEMATDHGLDMRCYFPLEMDALLRLCGWEIVDKFGDFNDRQFESNSSKQIFVCRPIAL